MSFPPPNLFTDENRTNESCLNQDLPLLVYSKLQGGPWGVFFLVVLSLGVIVGPVLYTTSGTGQAAHKQSWDTVSESTAGSTQRR